MTAGVEIAAGPADGSGRGIRFDGVHKAFATPGGPMVEALSAVDLTVPARQFVAIIGPSGCGKSTLLRLADGLVLPDRGVVSIDGRVPVPGPSTGLVFQNFRLIPWRNSRDNVGFALEGTGLDAGDIHDRAMAMLRQVGLEAWWDRYPAQLSGGMRQRVALARALVGQPDILLMDEPFASLDAQTRELMQEDLMRLHQDRQPTVLFVTHGVDEALLLADRVIVMGGGRVLDDVALDWPRPRSVATVQALPGYGDVRSRLWNQIRQLVLKEPASAFFGRKGDDES